MDVDVAKQQAAAAHEALVLAKRAHNHAASDVRLAYDAFRAVMLMRLADAFAPLMADARLLVEMSNAADACPPYLWTGIIKVIEDLDGKPNDPA